MKKKIVILTCTEDLHTESVVNILKEKYFIEPIILEREFYGESWTISGSIINGEPKSIIEYNNKSYSIDELGAFWNRRNFTTETTKKDSSSINSYIASQCSMHVNGLFRYISNIIPTMNKPLANANATSKFYQNTVALKNELKVPPSFFGGSPDLAFDFINSIDQNDTISIKPIESTHLKMDDGNTYAHYNSIFEKRPRNQLDSLSDCPVILQKFIEKKMEFRVTVVGQEIFTASIDTSKASREAKVDWRHYDWANTPYRTCTLPKIICDKILGLMNDLNLVFGAIDLILDQEDQFHFLEVNPQGQWLWVEDLTELKISECISDWLFQHSRN
jgi:glutathione synthase/RimK-type ligase-like ATP-grasp enzyme